MTAGSTMRWPAMPHLERRLDQMEARSDSFDLGARGLEKEFATLEGESRIELELAELKARLGRA